MFAEEEKQEQQWSSQKWESCRDSVMAEQLKGASARNNEAAKNQIHKDIQEHKEVAGKQLKAIPVPALEKGKACWSR